MPAVTAFDATFEVLTIGRVSADIYPFDVGVPLERVTHFGRFLGGSPTNVAVAAAHHGRRSAVITRTGDDPFGRFVHNEMRALNVDDRFVSTVPGLLTPVTFCEVLPPDSFPLYFYREPTAPDLEIRADELDLEAIACAGVFWATVGGLSREPSRSAHAVALGARPANAITVLDLDYRPSFWPDAPAAHREIRRMLPLVSVVVGNVDECEIAVGARDPLVAARRLLDAGPTLVVVKLGSDGALGVTERETVHIPAHKIEVVNGLGAGDGFGGALCHGLLSHWALPEVLSFANAAGAIVASRLQCSTAMPTTAEVVALQHSSTHMSEQHHSA
jgi:5-dehydro-2-deoxygluconokinase